MTFAYECMNLRTVIEICVCAATKLYALKLVRYDRTRKIIDQAVKVQHFQASSQNCVERLLAPSCPVSPSAWNNSALTERILMKFNL